MKVRLIERGSGGQKVHEFGDGEILIGRGSDNQLNIEDSAASRRHAQLTIAENSCQLRDLGSSNGTFIGQERITNRELKNGDVFLVGRTKFEFQSVAQSASTRHPVSDAPPPLGSEPQVGQQADVSKGKPNGRRSSSSTWLYAIFSVVIIGAIFIFFIPAYPVQSGTVLSCSLCNREISNTVTTQHVPFIERSNYSISRSTGMCNECGTQPVNYSIRYHCKRCGKLIGTEVKTALRRETPTDQDRKEGYCDDRCRALDESDHFIDKGTQILDKLSPTSGLGNLIQLP